MLRFTLLTITLLCSNLTLANTKSYQVDLILFATPSSSSNTTVRQQNKPNLVANSKTIPLIEGSPHPSHPFELLKPSSSDLNNEYYRLTHHAAYKVLAHYSWRQPISNQKAVQLPAIHQKGWDIQGSVRIQRSNYYSVDAQLHFSPPNNPESTFFLTQKQRVKEGVVYYFDHPQLGMILKIHH